VKTSNYLLSALTLATLLFTSCSSDDENIIVPTPDEGAPPITKLFTSTNITSLESEVTTAVGTSFRCHNQILFDECYDAASNLVAVINNGYTYTLPNLITINLSNIITARNSIVLKFDNSQDLTRSTLNDHRLRHTTVTPPVPPTGPTTAQVENDFLNQTQIKLVCRVNVNKCIKTAEKLFKLYDSHRLTSRLDTVIVDNTNPTYSRERQVLIKSRMSEDQIYTLISSYRPTTPRPPVPPITGIARVRKEIRDLYDINLFCNSDVSASSCISTARNFLTAMKSQRSSNTTIIKVEVTTSRRPQSTREILRLNSSYDLQTIKKVLTAHGRRH
jgi:hypothetical protein